MRILILCLVALSLLLCEKSGAASIPFNYSSHHSFFDSNVKKNPLNLSVIFPNKKVGLLKKLQLKVLQNRLKHLSKKADEGTQSKLNVLSIISLALGMIGVIVFFSFYSPIAFIASLAALITGIIALGKRRNNSKGSRAMAIIGTILGGGLILFVLVALIAWSGGW